MRLDRKINNSVGNIESNMNGFSFCLVIVSSGKKIKWNKINHSLDLDAFYVQYWLTGRIPEVDIIGPFKGCFYQILPWLINRMVITCKQWREKGTYRWHFNRVETKDKTLPFLMVQFCYFMSKWWSLSSRLHLLFITVCGNISCKWVHTLSVDKYHASLKYMNINKKTNCIKYIAMSWVMCVRVIRTWEKRYLCKQMRTLQNSLPKSHHSWLII